MLLNFSPFTFLFSLVYLVCLSLLPSISDFIMFWFLLEMLMLLFMGIAYTILVNSLSPLMVFFLMQTLSSFFILFSYLMSSMALFCVGVILKMGVGPAMGWFLYSVIHFPSLLLMISCTLHKLPILILMTQFSMNLPSSTFWLLAMINTLMSGVIMLSSFDLRYLLVASSVSNNSWFLVSQLSGMVPLLSFFLTYSFMLFLMLWSLSSLPSTRPFFDSSLNLVTILNLSLLSGLPPSPLFFMKVYTILCIPNLDPLTCLFLLSSCTVLCSYLIHCMHIIALRYNTGY